MTYLDVTHVRNIAVIAKQNKGTPKVMASSICEYLETARDESGQHVSMLTRLAGTQAGLRAATEFAIQVTSLCHQIQREENTLASKVWRVANEFADQYGLRHFVSAASA